MKTETYYITDNDLTKGIAILGIAVSIAYTSVELKAVTVGAMLFALLMFTTIATYADPNGDNLDD